MARTAHDQDPFPRPCACLPAPLKLAREKAPKGPSLTDAFQPRSDFLRTMQERGFVHQCSDLTGLDDKARSGALAGYIGFDCTAPSLHVGNLVGIMMRRAASRSR
jgi:hypothetical protein